MKKYFEFSGTIDGSIYFLRNLLATFVGFIGGYLLGYGLGSGDIGLSIISFLVLIPAVWFTVATIYKRLSALFPESATVLTVAMVTMQILVEFTGDGGVGAIINLGLFIFGLYLIFKNSGIKNHEG